MTNTVEPGRLVFATEDSTAVGARVSIEVIGFASVAVDTAADFETVDAFVALVELGGEVVVIMVDDSPALDA